MPGEHLSWFCLSLFSIALACISIALACIIGSVVGSFAGKMIYRLARGLGWEDGPSLKRGGAKKRAMDGDLLLGWRIAHGWRFHPMTHLKCGMSGSDCSFPVVACREDGRQAACFAHAPREIRARLMRSANRVRRSATYGKGAG